MKSLSCLVIVLLTSIFSPVTYSVVINEVRIDQPSSDNDEYFELVGGANVSLDGLTYLVIGDGSGGSGVIEAVVDLNGETTDTNGTFVVAESSFSLGTANKTATINFENRDNVTHLLVRGFTGNDKDDLDTNDDGTLDVTPWAEIVDSVALVESIGSGDLVYSTMVVGPNGSFVPAHVFRCDSGFEIGDFDPSGGKDTPGSDNSSKCSPTNTVTETTIPEIQSNGASSPLEGQKVKTTGVVVADFQDNDQLKGFFLQDPAGDGDVTTSDGVFVYDPNGADVNVGDSITIEATVVEFFGLTELKTVTSLIVNSTGNDLPMPASVILPESVEGELEQYEGMLVSIDVPMTVAQNYFLNRYGQLTLSSPDDQEVAGRLLKPTNIYPAGSQQAIDLADENARRTLFLDDGQDVDGRGDNPDPVPYLGAPGSEHYLRGGDTVSNLVGVLDYGRINATRPTPGRNYRLHPTQAPVFTINNSRPEKPVDTGGKITVASFNVLNYFTTIDTGAAVCSPTGGERCRGADSANELARQQDKLVKALVEIDADVVGLIEIENNGFGTSSAIATLVNAVNIELGSEVYAVLNVDEGVSPGVGGDVIKVGFIYKPGSVTPDGTPAILNTGAFSDSIPDGGYSRQPIAASFKENSSNEVFTTVVNHFKSKRPPSSPLGNANDDQGDGQGAWNLRRTEAATELADWLATNPTGVDDSDILIIGDINAYAKEDPILAFIDKGYKDMAKQFGGDQSYTYTFDGEIGSLDHALASESMSTQITGVTQWHANTDESPMLDYNVEFKSPAQASGYYSTDAFRASDHDAVIIGLNLGKAEEDEACYVIKAKNGNVIVFCL